MHGNQIDWRTVGRVGYLGRSRDRRFREFDRDHGTGAWRLSWEIPGSVLGLSEVSRYWEESYLASMSAQRQLIDRLVAEAREVYGNAHSNVRSGIDYSIQERKTPHVADIAVRNVLRRLGRRFAGERLIKVGGRSNAFPELSSGRVRFIHPEWILQPALDGWWEADSVECFWQSNRVLQVQTQSGRE